MRSATKNVLVLATMLLFVPLSLSAQAIEHPGRDNSEARVSPNASISQTIGNAVVSIEYSRPSVKGRDVFGGLQPYGEVWRTGANEATTIVIPKDAKVEGQDLPAGVYALFTIPGETEWKVVFNSTAKQWGHFKHDASADVLSVSVEPQEAHHAEMFHFGFGDVTSSAATLYIHWATTKVPVKIAFGG